MKVLLFWGNSLNDLRDFPVTARREVGYQLDKVQNGELPDDWKPMTTVGQTSTECLRGVSRDLCRQVRRCDLCASLLPEKDAKDQKGGSRFSYKTLLRSY